MKIAKQDLVLSPNHPSMLLTLDAESVFCSPVIIDQHQNLVDGYRRFQLQPDDVIEVVQISVTDLFEAAYEMNIRTRSWDDVDCFLWKRWATSIGASSAKLPFRKQSALLESAPIEMLKLIAQRRITMRQAVLIQEASEAARSTFLELLSNVISLNDNETADFIRMSLDLKNRDRLPGLNGLFIGEPFASILQNSSPSRRQKGEALLKEVRALRYPLYQKELENFTSNWQSLNLGRGIQTKSNSFIERSVLELSFTSSSMKELRENVTSLLESLDSPIWARIWKE